MWAFGYFLNAYFLILVIRIFKSGEKKWIFFIFFLLIRPIKDKRFFIIFADALVVEFYRGDVMLSDPSKV